MKPVPNWGVLFRDAIATIGKALADIKANKPLPPPPSSGDLLQGAQALQRILPPIIAYLDAHPGEIHAADDVLEALSNEFTGALELKQLIDASPGALKSILNLLPELAFVLQEFQPVGTGIVGDRR